MTPLFRPRKTSNSQINQENLCWLVVSQCTPELVSKHATTSLQGRYLVDSTAAPMSAKRANLFLHGCRWHVTSHNNQQCCNLRSNNIPHRLHKTNSTVTDRHSSLTTAGPNAFYRGFVISCLIAATHNQKTAIDFTHSQMTELMNEWINESINKSIQITHLHSSIQYRGAPKFGLDRTSAEGFGSVRFGHDSTLGQTSVLFGLGFALRSANFIAYIQSPNSKN